MKYDEYDALEHAIKEFLAGLNVRFPELELADDISFGGECGSLDAKLDARPANWPRGSHIVLDLLRHGNDTWSVFAGIVKAPHVSSQAGRLNFLCEKDPENGTYSLTGRATADIALLAERRKLFPTPAKKEH